MLASPYAFPQVWLLQIDGVVVVVLPGLRPLLRLLLFGGGLTASSSSGRLFEVHDQVAPRFFLCSYYTTVMMSNYSL
jgi:hypothetical protein